MPLHFCRCEGKDKHNMHEADTNQAAYSERCTISNIFRTATDKAMGPILKLSTHKMKVICMQASCIPPTSEASDIMSAQYKVSSSTAEQSHAYLHIVKSSSVVSA